MMTRPSWLLIVLVPVVFGGSACLSLRPIQHWLEKKEIRPVEAAEVKTFPVLTVSAGGQYRVSPLGDLPAGESVVSSVTRDDEAKINRSLNEALGTGDSHPFFRVLSGQGEGAEVELEVPTLRDGITKGWYVTERGTVRPQRRLDLGPGFAFHLMPLAGLAGAAGVGLLLLLRLFWMRVAVRRDCP